VIKPGAVLAAVRSRSRLLDHLVRAYQRYQADTGDRLAAAVTFYWFLSLFPILLLVLSVYGFVHSGESADQLNKRLSGNLGGFLPSQLVDTLSETLKGAKGKAGIIGLAGLLLSGLGWIDALREAIRTIWHQNVKAGNIITRKLVDIVALVGLFATVAASAFVTGLAGSGPKWLLGQVGVDKTTAAIVFLKVLGIALGVAVDVVLFLYLFLRLAKVRTPIRPVLKGAVFGAIGFGVLKLVGGFYVQHTTEKGKATYGTFAVVVGLLLFLNLVSRLILMASAFVVTGPGDDDVRPSGTADRQQAQKAGIPAEYADEQLTIQRDGAPTPLRSALQDEPVSPREPEGAAQVRRAAHVTAGVGGVVLAVVGVYVLKTFRNLLRR
jgi:membrane protein